MDLSEILILTSIAIAIVCLSIGSYFDLRSREIPDKVWIVQSICCFTLIVASIIVGDEFFDNIFLYIYGVLFGIILASMFYYMGSWGGGDAKAAIATSLAISIPILAFKVDDSTIRLIPPIFTVILNSFLLLLILPLIYIVRNLKWYFNGNTLFDDTSASIGRKIAHLCSGYRVSIEKAIRNDHLSIAETFENGKYALIKGDYMFDEERNKEIQDAIRTHPRDSIWIQTQPPGIPFLLVGLLFSLIVGNFVLFVLDAK